MTQQVRPVQPVKIAGNLLRMGRDLRPVCLTGRVRTGFYLLESLRGGDPCPYDRQTVIWKQRIRVQCTVGKVRVQRTNYPRKHFR